LLEVDNLEVPEQERQETLDLHPNYEMYIMQLQGTKHKQFCEGLHSKLGESLLSTISLEAD
jgi:hypothetical protein